VIAEAPFLFSVGGISASLAGLAGLVAGLRRADGLRGIDLFRLREIVEFSFANVVLALSIVPLSLLLQGTETAVRAGAAAAIVYLVTTVLVLVSRQRQLNIPAERVWYMGAALLNLAAVLAAAATIVTGTIGAFELMLVILVARPMLAFLLVLSSFDRS
jgi:hypothetical protein